MNRNVNTCCVVVVVVVFVAVVVLFFSFINFPQVPREMLKTEGKVRGFQHLPGYLANLMNWKPIRAINESAIVKCNVSGPELEYF